MNGKRKCDGNQQAISTTSGMRIDALRKCSLLTRLPDMQLTLPSKCSARRGPTKTIPASRASALDNPNPLRPLGNVRPLPLRTTERDATESYDPFAGRGESRLLLRFSLSFCLLCPLAIAADQASADPPADPAEGQHDMLLLLPDGPVHLRVRVTDDGKTLKQTRQDYLTNAGRLFGYRPGRKTQPHRSKKTRLVCQWT